MDRDPAWIERFNARWRDLHNRFDVAEAEQLERRRSARHNNVGESYQHIEEAREATLKLYTEAREEIARTVPATLAGHLFKLSLFIGDSADGLDVGDDQWADIRVVMNGPA